MTSTPPPATFPPRHLFITPPPRWEAGAVIETHFIPDPGEAPEEMPLVVWCLPPTVAF